MSCSFSLSVMFMACCVRYVKLSVSEAMTKLRVTKHVWLSKKSVIGNITLSFGDVDDRKDQRTVAYDIGEAI